MVRLGQAEDILGIVALIVEVHQSLAYVAPGIDRDKTYAYVLWLMQNGLVLVAEEDQMVVGSLGVEEVEPWYTRIKVLSDVWFYIKPEYRASRIAKEFLGVAKKVSDDSGMPVQFCVSHGFDLERKDVWFKRNGFRNVGGIYIYGELVRWRDDHRDAADSASGVHNQGA